MTYAGQLAKGKWHGKVKETDRKGNVWFEGDYVNGKRKRDPEASAPEAQQPAAQPARKKPKQSFKRKDAKKLFINGISRDGLNPEVKKMIELTFGWPVECFQIKDVI